MSSPENTKQQGDVGVAMAIAYYTKNKLVVSVPLTDNARYDLVVERNGVLLRVQCKTSNAVSKSGNYKVQLKTSGGNQSWNKTSKKISSTETDILFAYSFDNKMFEFPVDVVTDKSSITLCDKYKEYEVFFK